MNISTPNNIPKRYLKDFEIVIANADGANSYSVLQRTRQDNGVMLTYILQMGNGYSTAEDAETAAMEYLEKYLEFASNELEIMKNGKI